MLVTVYLRIFHQRERQAGLSTAHSDGKLDHWPASSPEAVIKMQHLQTLENNKMIVAMELPIIASVRRSMINIQVFNGV